MSSREPSPHTGRFAPSPTGPLHYGSLIAAVASYLQARHNHGRWLLRIEDIDPPRQIPGADRLIVDALECYGLEWDGPIIFQQASTSRHLDIVSDLLARGLAYRCSCSRRKLRNAADGRLGKIYPGYCRAGTSRAEFAIRLRVSDETCEFDDGLQGIVAMHLESESGDFIIRRRDGLIAYHLAVVVDDHAQGINEIVRGIDLLDSTPLHLFLQKTLGYAAPKYWHIPVAINADGQKLSKLAGAPGIPLKEPVPVLLKVLRDLKQTVPASLRSACLRDLWDFAIENWDITALRSQKTVAAHNSSMAGPENGLR